MELQVLIYDYGLHFLWDMHIYTYIYNKSMILPTIFRLGYMLLSPLGDIFVYILNLRIGLFVYGFHVVHCGSLEQVNIAIMFSFRFVYIKSY